MDDLTPMPSDAEIEARLKQAREKATASIDEDTDTLDAIAARMERLEAKIQSAGMTRMPEPPEVDIKPLKIPGKFDNDKANTYLGMGVGLSVAYSIVGTTAAGLIIGYLIKMGTGSEISIAIGTLIGAVAGLGSGIFVIIRAQNKEDAKERAAKK